MKQHLLLSFLISLSLFSPGQNVPSYVPTNGLVGWWPFNGNANDESGNGYTYTGAINSFTFDRFGRPNNAIDLSNQTNNITTNYYGILGQNPRTINLWFKVIGTGGNDPNFFGYGSGLGGGWAMYITNLHSTIDNSNSAIQYNPVVTLQTWHMFTVTYDLSFGTNTLACKVYIDNVQLTNIFSNYNGNQILNTGIGSPITFANLGPSNAIMDDVGMWNRVLSQQEITNLYNASLPPACPSLPSNLQSGLVGYWPFCGNANDESGNGNHGIVNGATLTVDRFGDSGKAYSFDGNNDFIEVSISQTLSFSLSLWASPNAASVINGLIQHKDNCARGGGYILELINNNSLRLYANNCGQCYSSTCSNLFNRSVPIVIDSAKWYHFVLTCDGIKQYKLYIDGLLLDSVNNSNTLSQYNVPLSFGKHHDGAQDLYFFKGREDDICLWNRTLSPQEVTQLYQTQSSNSVDGKIGVNVPVPQRSLHIKDVIRLEPRSSSPENPVSGDMYFDGILKKLRVYDGTTWQNCW